MGNLVSVKVKGDFISSTRFLESMIKKPLATSDFYYYAEQGLEALSSATPADTGELASSWHYEVETNDSEVKIRYYNSKSVDGVPIAIILNYGHGTRNGGWVEGRDYINPAVQPIFDKIVDDAWKGVISR